MCTGLTYCEQEETRKAERTAEAGPKAGRSKAERKTTRWERKNNHIGEVQSGHQYGALPPGTHGGCASMPGLLNYVYAPPLSHSLSLCLCLSQDTSLCKQCVLERCTARSSRLQASSWKVGLAIMDSATTQRVRPAAHTPRIPLSQTPNPLSVPMVNAYAAGLGWNLSVLTTLTSIK